MRKLQLDGGVGGGGGGGGGGGVGGTVWGSVPVYSAVRWPCGGRSLAVVR